MITIAKGTPAWTTPEMLEARLSMLTSQLESEWWRVREDVLATLVRDLYNVEWVTEEFQQRLSSIIPDFRHSIFIDKLVFMENNPASFSYNFWDLLEEIPNLSALSELEKQESRERVMSAEQKSKAAKKELLGGFYED